MCILGSDILIRNSRDSNFTLRSCTDFLLKLSGEIKWVLFWASDEISVLAKPEHERLFLEAETQCLIRTLCF